MRPQTETLSAAGLSTPFPVNWRERDFTLGIGVSLSAGASLTYSVQYSVDDPESFTDATDYNTNGNWFDDASLAAATAGGFTTQMGVVRAVRLNITAHTSGDATITILQAT